MGTPTDGGVMTGAAGEGWLTGSGFWTAQAAARVNGSRERSRAFALAAVRDIP
ncbi:MAG TPA: hypothetical protein VM571_09930 [Noviherbaspirillum sp.]|nr:hypothetical protein [Noviherbaspirillum sp.]